MGADDGLNEARSAYYRHLREWKPTQDPGKLPRSAELCSVKRESDPSQLLYLSYGWSYAPFEHYRQQKDRPVFVVNDDVLLTSGPDRQASYHLYVRCQIPGALPQQKDEVPVSGSLTDTLTGETDPRVPYTHLLHSARVMVEALGCTNKPVVPAQPPASVR
ncbi:hypothetical protein [Streptomyces sp. DH12]|uniref:hypothetical protein n=1 Tax=Streptomyces sp. DH12 TaxID=2857010 RepID=UPI001E38A1B2|nr:hypothetical protein [Streptomyces sp. DH12]